MVQTVEQRKAILNGHDNLSLFRIAEALGGGAATERKLDAAQREQLISDIIELHDKNVAEFNQAETPKAAYVPTMQDLSLREKNRKTLEGYSDENLRRFAEASGKGAFTGSGKIENRAEFIQELVLHKEADAKRLTAASAKRLKVGQQSRLNGSSYSFM